MGSLPQSTHDIDVFSAQNEWRRFSGRCNQCWTHSAGGHATIKALGMDDHGRFCCVLSLIRLQAPWDWVPSGQETCDENCMPLRGQWWIVRMICWELSFYCIFLICRFNQSCVNGQTHEQASRGRQRDLDEKEVAGINDVHIGMGTCLVWFVTWNAVQHCTALWDLFNMACIEKVHIDACMV